MVTSEVEVLEIQRVVPSLMEVSDMKLALTALELDRKDRWT